uniref:(northern house mosquito) hypothetical protein n=1 Tax=Culex pipiens TaxID=7175 RepID=A0A8D8CLN2_CULPI
MLGDYEVQFVRTNRGQLQLCVDGYLFNKNKLTEESQFWACNQSRVTYCPVRATTSRVEQPGPVRIALRGTHNHLVLTERRPWGERVRLTNANKSLMARQARKKDYQN